MGLLTSPESLRLRSEQFIPTTFTSQVNMGSIDFVDALKKGGAPHSSHPDFWHLVLLVFEAVLEVVCVSFPGYIVARLGMFDADAQKFVANLNVMLFTPCLIFTKLASQLTADKLVELAIIPCIFVVQTFVSYLCAVIISRMFRFKKRPRNFVIAMAVFGNSNSLPISLVLSLSKTISGLHWRKIPGDNDNEVGARGILYLLIFQQLGQLVRWTWGYNVLLAPAEKQNDDDRSSTLEQEGTDYERQNLLGYGSDLDSDNNSLLEANGGESGYVSAGREHYSDYESGTHTPVPRKHKSSSCGSSISDGITNDNDYHDHAHSQWRHGISRDTSELPQPSTAPKSAVKRFNRAIGRLFHGASRQAKRVFSSLPQPLQRVLTLISVLISRLLSGILSFMNPPLWAMLAAIIVASIPPLQHAFFDPGTFMSNSVTRAVKQSGGVAVPLILVVLGANLARNTIPRESLSSSDDPKEERNLLIAALFSRMLFPTILMTPLLALTAKFVPVSILDDPIFVIVCFLLTGAPSALQLAQICQINNVYMGAMSRLLFQSYVIWILPSTLVLVTLALEVVEWAAA